MAGLSTMKIFRFSFEADQQTGHWEDRDWVPDGLIRRKVSDYTVVAPDVEVAKLAILREWQGSKPSNIILNHKEDIHLWAEFHHVVNKSI